MTATFSKLLQSIGGLRAVFRWGRRRRAMPHAAIPCVDVIHPGRSAADIHAFFLGQIDEQRFEAERHRASSHWTDRNTGRNIGMDEFEAIWAMECIAARPSEIEAERSKAYADRLLSDLAQTGQRFRATAEDPDGYGIATIGTVEREVRNFAFIPAISPQHK